MLRGQSPSLQQKLYYTCKVWGFVKYYHSNVAGCRVNWDSVLIGVLPAVRTAASDSEFNDALDTMLFAAGRMALPAYNLPDTIPVQLKRNRNWNWLNDAIFRTDVVATLDTIRSWFRPQGNCYVINNNYTTSNTGWLLFPYDDPILNINTFSTFPNADHRMLILFKYWNIMDYFNPYNYVLDKPIDTILFNNVLLMDTASNPYSFYGVIRKITAAFDDGHVQSWTYSTPIDFSTSYVPKIALRYIDSSYVVIKSGIPAISVGDIILSVGGRTVKQIEDSVISYTSVGNAAVFHRFMCRNLLLGGQYTSGCFINYQDPSGAIYTATVTRATLYGDSTFFPRVYFPADSLQRIKWTTMNCGVGYVNTSYLSVTEADSAYDALKVRPAIIVDLRNDT